VEAKKISKTLSLSLYLYALFTIIKKSVNLYTKEKCSAIVDHIN